MYYFDLDRVLRRHDVGLVTEYTTKETIVTRLITKILASIPMTLQEYHNLVTTQFYVHPECSYVLKLFLEKREVPLSGEELAKVRKVLSSDFHDRERVEEMADIVYNRVREMQDPIVMWNFNYLFAVDGLGPDGNFKHYIDHLRIPYRNLCDDNLIGSLRVHVNAVRSLYDYFQLEINPDKLREALLKVYRREEIDIADGDREAERSNVQLLYSKRTYFIEDPLRENILKKKIEEGGLKTVGLEEEMLVPCEYAKMHLK